MKVKINENEITVVNCYSRENSNRKNVIVICANETDISTSELKELIKGNTGDITLVRDDGTQEVFCGYRGTAKFSETIDYKEDGTTSTKIFVEIECTAEAERYAEELKTSLNAQLASYKKENDELSAKVTSLMDENESLNAQLLDTQLALVELDERIAQLTNITTNETEAVIEESEEA